jgi:DNA modification methylase
VSVRILIGDVRDRLRELPDASVHCIVTSPPYFWLRDYGVEGQIGLEATPAEFVETIVEVFREARRVLRDDGTLWLNLGDSYAGSWGAQGRNGQMADRSVISARQIDAHPQRARQAGTIREAGLKAKDLIGIPWRVAFALQADGWWLRQDIIWAKPNPMPESVRDRCTKAHEYLFLLSKGERYQYDADAIKEAAVASDLGERDGGAQRLPNGSGANGGRNFRQHLPGNKSHRGITAYESGDAKHRTKAGLVAYSTKVNADPDQALTRNKRSVWTVATQPFGEAHFATFPPALVEPCVLAGCPIGGTVLDPFAGTTGLVADRLGRNAILIELNPEYAAIAERRIKSEVPMFADITLEPAA